MSKNFIRERLEILSRIVEINSIIADRLAYMVKNVYIWTPEEFNYHNDLIESLQDERQELIETLQKL